MKTKDDKKQKQVKTPLVKFSPGNRVTYDGGIYEFIRYHTDKHHSVITFGSANLIVPTASLRLA